jgi:hypothetical protein
VKLKLVEENHNKLSSRFERKHVLVVRKRKRKQCSDGMSHFLFK